MEESKELRQCSRCHSNILLKYFDINRKGEYYKLCNKCRRLFPCGKLDMTNDEYSQYRKEYQTTYQKENKDKINERRKEYYEKHPEKLEIQKEKKRERNKEQIICICGGSYTAPHKSQHEKTLKHQNYLKNVQ